MLWWHPRDAVLAIGVYVALQALCSSTWLVFAYRVADFNVRGLTLLFRDAVISVGLATALLGAIHIFLQGWPAFLLFAAVAACMIAIAFVRYVSTGRAFSSTADRFRQFWPDKNTTLKGRDDEEFRRAEAHELKNLFPTQTPGRVLEIGCGDGTQPLPQASMIWFRTAYRTSSLTE